MRDRQQLEELTGAVSLGVLAEEMVLAAGRVLRREALGDRERQSLRMGHQLLERASSAKFGVVPPEGPRRMDTDEAYLDAFRAVRLQAPGEPAQEYLRKLAAVLSRVLGEEELTPEDHKHLAQIQEFFARIGELTLARANDFFDKSRKEPFPWMRIRERSPSKRVPSDAP
jgi:hypothetical protein